MSELSAHHVGITVSDLEKTLAFYRETLGLELVDRFEVGGDAFADAVDVDGASARFAHLEADGVRLELVAYDPGAPARSTPDLDEPGATHVGLAVDDLEAVYDELPDDEFPDDVPTLSEPRTTESGTSICFLRDPEGNLVELLET